MAEAATAHPTAAPGPPGPTAPGAGAAAFAAARGLHTFRALDDALLQRLIDAGLITHVELPRDALLTPPASMPGAICFVVSGQLAVGVFDPDELRQRGRPQRDATRGEADGTLMPPGPMARTARHNLAVFDGGEAFNLDALPTVSDAQDVRAFALRRVSVLLLAGETMTRLATAAPAVVQILSTTLAHTAVRLRSVVGIKHEILDFYVRHGMVVAGPMVRIRQLDLCIDCKQCEDACESRHGARRLTLGGYELGLLDFVFTCRSCTDARCLSPCEHDAIKRDGKTGEVIISEDRCIGCSLCSLSCPYGAINMVNVAEPEQATYNPRFKARLDKGGKLAHGPGKGRKALARQIANKCDHCAGHGDQACVSACPTGALIEVAPEVLFQERGETRGSRRRKRLHVLPSNPFLDGLNVRDSGLARVTTRTLNPLLWLIGLGSVLAVAVEVGLRWLRPTWSVSYRLLLRDGLSPALAEMNVSYLAGTKLALVCGYVGTALMTLSMAYLLQRRFGWFRRTASNQFWLDVHIMTGLVGPMFIALHSAMRLSTWVSIPFWSMVAVVVSGLIGRYLYTLVPSMANKHDLAILEHRRAVTEIAADHPDAAAYAYQLMEREAVRARRAWNVGLIALLGWVLIDDLRRMWTRRRDRRALARLTTRKLARQLALRIDRVVFYERRKELAPRGKALLRSWKRVHIPFSVVLLFTTLLHIVLALHLV
ncbi:MAG: 4Fe-4S binding protein [Kofleriaceae bacterium]|nr:4Fe-4S binding protein [Kofleriaceae bacterium]